MGARQPQRSAAPRESSQQIGLNAPRPQAATPLEELKVSVERVRFRAPDSPYHVLVARCRKEEVVVTGHFQPISEGDQLKLTGRWAIHSRHGRHFACETYQVLLPSTVKGIEAFLGGGMIKGIGPKTAALVVKHFGAKTLEIIRDEPERLSEVPKIGKDKARRICQGLAEHQSVERVMATLQGFGVSSAYALKIHKHFGEEAVRVLQERPFDLTEVHGIGFLVADAIATKIGIQKNEPRRIEEGILYVLKENGLKGHVCMPHSELTAEAARVLEAEPEAVLEAVLRLLENRRLEYRGIEGKNFYYEPVLFASEQGTATRLQILIEKAEPIGGKGAALKKLIKRAEQGLRLTFAPKQHEAVETALTAGVTVLTGGPGTGKTTIVRAIVDLCEVRGKAVALAAPTGKAAKRMSEATGRPARTIHRLLEYDGRTRAFARNQENPIEADMVIVDEASMLDVILAYQLLRAVRPGASVLLVGDVDQLPSVGPGRVLADIIDSGQVPTVRLNEIWRQAQGSLIIVNAHRVNQGESVLHKNPAGTDPDFFFLKEEDPEKLGLTLVDLVARRLPQKYGFDPIREIQVLSPMRKGEIGVHALNTRLQETLNPASGGAGASVPRDELPGRGQGDADQEQLRPRGL